MTKSPPSEKESGVTFKIPIMQALPAISCLPINILTMGLTTPLINVVILKITNLILGSKFVVNGWIIPIFIAIFISVVNVLLNNLIVDKYKERR